MRPNLSPTLAVHPLHPPSQLVAEARWILSSAVFNVASCVLLYANLIEPLPGELSAEVSAEGGWGIGIGSFHGERGIAGLRAQLLWTFLALAVFCQAIVVFEAAWSIDSDVGVFFLTVVNMLYHDIAVFMPFFLSVVLAFWLTMYALYPSSLQNVQEFNANSPIETLNAIFLLAVAGEGH